MTRDCYATGHSCRRVPSSQYPQHCRSRSICKISEGVESWRFAFQCFGRSALAKRKLDPPLGKDGNNQPRQTRAKQHPKNELPALVLLPSMFETQPNRRFPTRLAPWFEAPLNLHRNYKSPSRPSLLFSLLYNYRPKKTFINNCINIVQRRVIPSPNNTYTLTQQLQHDWT